MVAAGGSAARRNGAEQHCNGKDQQTKHWTLLQATVVQALSAQIPMRPS